uniref:SWIM-type domain-containing protein n=1 Tax=Ananas comosus var. bracteatus TaxID=296719 RepID=A0A6V7NHJ9_ANACO|nr:unnamed protein product [Ananas comosus var. bracteatus]
MYYRFITIYKKHSPGTWATGDEETAMMEVHETRGETRRRRRRRRGSVCQNVNAKVPSANKAPTYPSERALSSLPFHLPIEEPQSMLSDRTDVVDLSKKTCSCKRWDIDGIPCNHAMAAFSFRLRDPYDFVEDWFMTSTYRATYNDCVPPTRGKEQWPAIPSNVVPPRPPNVRIQLGRRKVSRRESIANGLIKKRCRNCQRWGHNKRSCKNPPVARANQPPATTSAAAPQETSLNPYVLL